MLPYKKDKTLRALIKLIGEKPALLITPPDLINCVAEEGMDQEMLEKTLNDLFLEGYIDLVYSERQKERVYCITLCKKGKEYERARKEIVRGLVYKLIVTAIFAVISFVFGLILKAIFT